MSRWAGLRPLGPDARRHVARGRDHTHSVLSERIHHDRHPLVLAEVGALAAEPFGDGRLERLVGVGPDQDGRGLPARLGKVADLPVNKREDVDGGGGVEDGHRENGAGERRYTDTIAYGSMTHETSTRTAPDGLTLFTRRWTPDLRRRGVVVLVHGVHEHSGRYGYVASELMRHGFEVRAIDLRGHGESEGPRGQVETFEDYVADVSAFLSDVLTEAGGVPVFLMGHSMGGLVVADTVVARGTDVLAGVVLSSAPLQVPQGTPAIKVTLAPLIARWLPNAPATRLNYDKLSRDPAVVRAYKSDPLVTKQGVRARLAYEMMKAFERVRNHPEAFDVPLYLFHGTADAVTDPEGTAWLAEHAASDDVTLHLYDGLFHETLNEPERDRVIGDLADWLVTHTE